MMLSLLYLGLFRLVGVLIKMEIRQILQDRIEILFNPLKEKLEPGDNLKIIEIGKEKRGLIAQIIELKTIDYRSLIEEQLRTVTVEQFKIEDFVVEEDISMLDMKNLKVAVVKIRKEIKVEKNNEKWKEWRGWIPTRNVEIIKIKSSELMSRLIEASPFPLFLGKTPDNVNLKIKGENIEQVNVITSVKGAGKSHLAKVILLELIEQGGECIVFDINREYSQLPQHIKNQKGVINLIVGKNLKLNVVEFGLGKLCNLFLKFGYYDKTVAAFQAHFKDIFDIAFKTKKFIPFVSLKEELETALDIHKESKFALERGIDQLNMLDIFANKEEEFTLLEQSIQKIKSGGALVMDISILTDINRKIIVPALIEFLKDIIKKGDRLFLFFEEAHMYLEESQIIDLISRIRHFGASTIFITNMITALPEVVLRQLDNLFLLKLPHEKDVLYVSAGAPIDDESIKAFAMRIPFQEAILVGKATNNYPIRFKPNPLEKIETAGETKYFFKDKKKPISEVPLKTPSNIS